MSWLTGLLVVEQVEIDRHIDPAVDRLATAFGGDEAPVADGFDGGVIQQVMAAAGGDADLAGLATGKYAHLEDDLAFPLPALG